MYNQNDTFPGNDFEQDYNPVISLEDMSGSSQEDYPGLVVDSADIHAHTPDSADPFSGDYTYSQDGMESEPYLPETDSGDELTDFFSSAFTPSDADLYHFSDEETRAAVEAPQPAKRKKKSTRKERKEHPVLVAVANGLLSFTAVMCACYLLLVYSSNPFITKIRNMYISTAMSTLSHKYLATAVIPSEIIDDLLRTQYEADANAVGLQSTWGNVQVEALPTFSENNDTADEDGETAAAEENTEPTETATIAEDESGKGRTYGSPEEKQFFELFPELDYDSVMDYLDSNPGALSDGWGNIDINEAGLDDYGTSMTTTNGDEVLAINADQGVILIRMYINSSRGILAICKDTSRLSLCPASTLGTIGQTAGNICEANYGILGITGSAFMDDGSGNGGQISGLAVCSGSIYGSALGGSDKRLELRNDNRMYIVDSVADVNSDTRDACEFRPALIIDGEVVVDDSCGWTSPNPRAVLGQSARLETMFFVLEGRYVDSPGDSVVNIAYQMQKYGCVQAMNLDGGTSAIMYYDGEYVTRCSNSDLPGGRTLPTAWVYHRS